MGLHPAYLNQFLRTEYFILRGDGPLPYAYRHYIAIMAAGRHQCSYLINLQIQEFLSVGGNPNWLNGLAYVPCKLRNIYEINKLLAHRPWLLSKTHIEKLTKGGGADSWSLAELMHAIVILTHYHSLCSFVFSCGVNEQLVDAHAHRYKATGTCSVCDSYGTTSSTTSDSDNVTPATVSTTNSTNTKTVSESSSSSNKSDTAAAAYGGGGGSSSGSGDEVGIVQLMARMKTLSEQTEEPTPTELIKRFENVESQTAELTPVDINQSPQLPAEISQFIDDVDYQYHDFAKRDNNLMIQTFRVHDYSWDDHGYSLVNRLFNDIGYLLDDKFKTTYNLTYYTMGGRKDVDTSRFRRAIWNYCQCMFGIRHDDYDYGEVNHLLERSVKTFIKTACCYPERVTKREYDCVLREFEHSEKIHVNLMVLESRMQAELLYALRAITRYIM